MGRCDAVAAVGRGSDTAAMGIGGDRAAIGALGSTICGSLCLFDDTGESPMSHWFSANDASVFVLRRGGELLRGVRGDSADIVLVNMTGVVAAASVDELLLICGVLDATLYICAVGDNPRGIPGTLEAGDRQKELCRAGGNDNGVMAFAGVSARRNVGGLGGGTGVCGN